MAKANSLLAFPEIISVLGRYCDSASTGTLMVSTDDNHCARFTLQKGVIASLSFARKRGAEALDMFKRVRAGRCAFYDAVTSSNDGSLPDNQEIFRRLNGGSRFEALGEGVLSSRPASKTVDSAATETMLEGVDADKAIDLETLQQIATLLANQMAKYLGPVAPLVFGNYQDSLMARQTPTQLAAIVQELAGEIDDPQRRGQFLQAVETKVAGLLGDQGQ